MSRNSKVRCYDGEGPSDRCPSSLCRGGLTGAERRRARLELEFCEAGIKAVLGDESLMRALFDQLAIVENQYAAGFEDCREPMCDDERGAFGHHPFERALNHDLIFGIERGCRFVEKQHR